MAPNNSWTFVPAEHIAKPNDINYVVDNNRTVVNSITIGKNVTVINNLNNSEVINNVTTNNFTNNNVTNNITNKVVYNKGPEVNEVENVAIIKVQRVTINE